MPRLFASPVLRLALPAVGSAMVPLLHRTIDMLLCRQLGTDATAALTVSTVAIWIQYAVGLLVSVGLTAIVARYAGAGRVAGARYAAGQGVRFAVLLGLVGGGLGILLTPFMFDAVKATEQVRAWGAPYARVHWGSGVFVMVAFAGDAIFRAHANTRTPLLIALSGLVLNAGLSAMLIHGAGPVPALGVEGAAWATFIATGFAAGLHLLLLGRNGLAARTRPDDNELRLGATTRLGRPQLFGIDRAMVQRVARVGLPATAASLLFNTVYLVLMRCTEEAGGAAGQAGMGVGHTGEGLAYVMGLGWSAAAAALVGRALGAENPRAAEAQAWSAARQCALFSGLWALVLFLGADIVAGWFAEGEAARQYGADYFRVVSPILALQAFDLVLTGALGGAGYTLPPMLISAVFTLARIPLAYYAAFTLGWGIDGIWWVITITAALRAAMIIGLFRRGTWKTRAV